MPSQEKIRIHLFHKLPTPYNDLLFRALHSHAGIELLVHHLWRSRWNRPWTVELATGYPNHYLKTRLGIDWGLVKTGLFERESFFVVGDWAHVPSIALLLVRIFRRASVSIWSDTPQEQIHRPWLKKVLRRAFLCWLLPRMDVVFGTGEPARRSFMAMGVPEGKIVNLPCFVDLQTPLVWHRDIKSQKKSRSFRELVGCSDEGVVFLMSGACVSWKGQDIGIRAFAACRCKLETKMGMIIAGEGPDRRNLEDLARALGVSDQVAFLGWLNPDEMNVAYSACDVVVLSSRRDAYPLVVLESMSWGKIVIASDVCGSAQDRIIQGVNGYIFPSEKIDALSSIMGEAVSNPERMQRIGLEARRTAEQWPVERGVETIVQTAQKVMNQYK